MKTCNVLVLVLVGLILTVGATTRTGRKTIRANRFELLDESGKVCGIWSSDANSVNFRLLDETGKTAVRLRVDPTWKVIAAHDSNGVPRAGLKLFNTKSKHNLGKLFGECDIFHLTLGTNDSGVILGRVQPGYSCLARVSYLHAPVFRKCLHVNWLCTCNPMP